MNTTKTASSLPLLSIHFTLPRSSTLNRPEVLDIQYASYPLIFRLQNRFHPHSHFDILWLHLVQAHHKTLFIPLSVHSILIPTHFMRSRLSPYHLSSHDFLLRLQKTPSSFETRGFGNWSMAPSRIVKGFMNFNL